MLLQFCLFGSETATFSHYDLATKKETVDLEWFNWFSSTPENAVSAIVKEIRQSAYLYYTSNNLADLNQLAISTFRLKKVYLDAGFEVQMAITSIYDGSRYYEGFSQACPTNPVYSLKEEVWKEMDGKAKEMALISYQMSAG